MQRYFLIFWLILSILGYGIAMAADMHAGLHGEDHQLTADHPAPHDADHEAGCDHCCHGFMHLLGLPKSHAFELVSCRVSVQTPYRVKSTSSPPSSLFRPPIAA